jgi:SnoaL-like domain
MGTEPKDVDAAVRELMDRAATTEVLHSYARLVDERDFAAVAGVFTEDCVAEYGNPDHAETTSYVHAWHRPPGASADPVILARYVDSFERTAAGWRIAHRRMFAHGLIGFPDGILRPLARK